MMLCHPVMAVRHVIETQKKKRGMRELSERGTTLRWTWGEISTSPPLKSPKTLITLSETTRVATLDPEL